MSEEIPDLFFYFLDRLGPRAEKLAESFRSAKPFPHIVLDDFLPSQGADYIERHFPRPDCPSFARPDNRFQTGKLGQIQNNQFRGVPQTLRQLLQEFNSMAFLEVLERLTGIRGLIPDAHFRGGAFHQILPGGRLEIHADFNIDVRRRLIRKLNVLLYFNKSWKREYGGNLELWDSSMSECQRLIEPLFNRCVVFETSSISFHGHPEPISDSAPGPRKSLAFYYYVADENAFDSNLAHSTIWKTERGKS